MNALNFFKKEDLLAFARENESYRYVIAMFTAEWCGSCKRMLKVFEQLLGGRREKDILLLQLDIEKNSTLSKDPFFAVSVTPKTFVFQKGDFWKQLEGSTDLHGLKEFLQL